MKEIQFDGAGLAPVHVRGQAAAAPAAESFGETVRAAITDLQRLQQDADRKVGDMATGKHVDIHQTMVALEKADVKFQLIMQVRNKVVAAYEEIMRMQI